uniref:Phosphatidic acid phosphatase type 2/haloperoxidase domain-containing protein n=1 Tax=Polytomella parva TaxID=51329 RepID=A0A7S0YLL9_9CHLO|mmetsp:Transcript_32203/g.58579  ORF Transcript_32203/g.58579 Transcript_32203/m.58579 type:complete len:257 (+) Transcript_32203:219-989(+)
MGLCIRALVGWFLTTGYIYDWLLSAFLILISSFIPIYTISPINRYYALNDASLQYPLKNSTIPNYALYILVFIFPAVVTGLYCLIKSKSYLEWHHICLTYAEGFALTTSFKRWMNLVGRYRPIWLALLSDTGSHKDGRLSYPSGHSAYMFFSMTILSLFLIGKTNLFIQSSQAHFAVAFICLMPLMLATFVAVSRIANYKHNPSDVNAGCFVGMACGAFCYFLNYHHPFGVKSGSIRTRDPCEAKEKAFTEQSDVF